MLLVEVDDGSFPEQHGAAGVALEVGMHHKGRIYPPVNETHVCCFKCQAESRISLELLENPAQFGPVIFVGVLDPCGGEGEGCPGIVP